MQPEQIMSSDLLDILFADRNKSYGAYALRRDYNRRLHKALLITGAFVCGALALFYYTGSEEPGAVKKNLFELTTVLHQLPEKPEPPPPPAPPPPPSKQPVATAHLATPVIVKADVKADPPPPIDDLINAQPGFENRPGIPTEGFPPPVSSGTGNAPAPAVAAAEPDNSIQRTVDVESTYPGGLNAWKRFLIKTFRYPTEAEEKGVVGTVLIKFVVDKTGCVSDVEAVSGPPELRAEAIRVISKSGKWIPAMKHDSVVNSYKYQQIVFQLSE